MTKKVEVSSRKDPAEAQKKVPLAETGKTSLQKVDDAAHENPWIFVGAAAVIAGLVGFTLGRSFKD